MRCCSLKIQLVALFGVCLLTPHVDAESFKVATRAVPPFALQTEDGNWEGLAINLWNAVAEELDVETEYVATDVDDMIAGLSAQRYDAAVAALTMTAERETQVDFSHPYFRSGLGIAVSREGGTAWGAVLRNALSYEFLTAVGSLALLLLVIGALVWIAERKKNAEQFGGRVTHGLGSGFWWSAVTMTTVGYGDKAPVTIAGRLVALVWMFASIIIISGITAAIASALTVSQLSTGIAGPSDLPDVRVATVAGTTSEKYLDENLIQFERATETPQAALQALAAGEVDAVVYDAPVLRYLVKEHHHGQLRVLPREFEPQSYAIAMPSGTARLEAINRVILRHTSETEWKDMVKRYLGETE